MATFVNLTPHDVHVLLSDGTKRTFSRSGTIARCKVNSELAMRVDGIDFNRTSFGAVEDLPDPQPDTWYIVSMLVREAMAHRKDLVSPGESVRDGAGAIIGCRSFSV